MNFELAYVGENYVFFILQGAERNPDVEFIRITKDNWLGLKRPVELMITALSQGDG